MKLSLCLATYNEEANIHYPIESCIEWVDEVVVVDGGSTDSTVKIAQTYGKKVKIIKESNPRMFHINKQIALDEAKGEWILQLDADEAVSKELANEIQKIIQMDRRELEEYEDSLPKKELFLRHQEVIASKTNSVVKQLGMLKVEKDINAFFIPRSNYFLGKFLKYGGVYPDGAIRLIKKNKARFPCKDVHEIMEVDGRVGWLNNDILHYDSPTFERYIKRNDRYVNLMTEEFEDKKLPINILNFFIYVIVKPLNWFFMTTFRHKGILDGWQGVIFSSFSALRFPKAYIQYMLK